MKTILKFQNIKREDFNNLPSELKNATDIRYLIIEDNGNFTESIAGKEIKSGSTYTELTQTQIDTGTSNISMVISPKLFKDNLNTKVDKIVGKGLSTEDFTTEEKLKLAGLESVERTPSEIKVAYESNPDTNAFTDSEKASVEKIPTIESDVLDLQSSKADKTELFSGSYNDLADKPTIPTKTSELTNDSGLATETYIADKINQIELMPGPKGEKGDPGTKGEMKNYPAIPQFGWAGKAATYDTISNMQWCMPSGYSNNAATPNSSNVYWSTNNGQPLEAGLKSHEDFKLEKIIFSGNSGYGNPSMKLYHHNGSSWVLQETFTTTFDRTLITYNVTNPVKSKWYRILLEHNDWIGVSNFQVTGTLYDAIGLQGPEGPQGPKGPKGDKGNDGLTTSVKLGDTTKTQSAGLITFTAAELKSAAGLENVTNESKATIFTNSTLTGTPTAPTAATETNTTQIATTAFVKAQNYQSAAQVATSINTAISSVYKYKGSIATFNDLPTTNRNVGDVYDVQDIGMNYAWNGTEWDALGMVIDLSNYATKTELTSDLSGKVDKVAGKQLSTEDFTTAEKTKLTNIESGAQANVQSDWNQTLETADDFIKNKPKFTAATDRDITALINVGAIESQDLIPQGTTLTEFIEKLVLTTFYPTYTAPSFLVTFRVNNSTTTTYEVGTVVDMTFTGTLNRGSITGAISNGIWVPTLSQNPRSGVVEYFTLAGENTGTTNTHTISDHTVKLGTESFQSSANYLQGPQPTDSKGNNYQTPLPAGRTNVVTSNIIGRRALFYGVNNNASNSSDIRKLSNKTLNPTNGTKFTINIPAGAANVIFAYPATLRDVTNVKYVEGLGAEVKDGFTMTTFNVEGANGFTADTYKVYKYTPVEPFGSTATYEVTI